MQFRAILRYAPMSARKAKPVVDLVRGLGVNQALEALSVVPRRAAPMLSKLIRSAIANAGQAAGVEAKDLVVRQVLADVGPMRQGRLRWRPGPRGRACPINKRSCHLSVVLEEAESGKKKAPRKAREKKPAEKKD
jgi:large subunit ribosomal protein L22